ncbi:MAG: nucleotidyltransferase family protein [Dehalococcoidales bacterium]|nr:nucleotidyltransferase family protein [Dehalococcoidales bacterium]
MKTGKFAAVILAAGYSRRMGRFKPLLTLGNETITDRLMTGFLENGVEVYLVTGYRQQELRDGITTRNIHFVENPDYERGMFSSVQAGLEILRDGFQAAFIAPVDIPLVRPETIRALITAAQTHPDSLLYPVYKGTRGHPPLVPAGLFPAILAWRGDGGLRDVLRQYRDMAVEVGVQDSDILFDIDVPADYEKLVRRYERNVNPK